MEAGVSRVALRLSEGQAQPETPVRLPLAVGEPLPEDEIARILARLPELVPEEEDQVDFRLAQDPIPPPLTGETIDEPFPPPPEGAAPDLARPWSAGSAALRPGRGDPAGTVRQLDFQPADGATGHAEATWQTSRYR